MMWEWMTDNWSAIEKKLPAGLSMLSTVVTICSSGFTKMEHVDKVEAFFKDRSTKGFDQSLAQSLDGIRARVPKTRKVPTSNTPQPSSTP